MVVREIVLKSIERETHSYFSGEDADTHDKFMIKSGWSRIDRYEYDDKVYQIFVRETELSKTINSLN